MTGRMRSLSKEPYVGVLPCRVLTVLLSIVFVHGLRGSRKMTWTKNGVFWPEALLTKDLEKCRIISFGYDSGVVHSDTAEITQGSLESDALDLCSLLTAERSMDGTVSFTHWGIQFKLR
jgi:hypothetical protein